MNYIYLYNNGSAVLIDTESPDQEQINGQAPDQIIESTPENVAKYFGVPVPESTTKTSV